MNYSRIKLVLEQKNKTVKWLCAEIGITEQGLAYIFKNRSMKVETVEAIAKALKVEPAYFFDSTDEKELVTVEEPAAGYGVSFNERNIFTELAQEWEQIKQRIERLEQK